MARQVKVNVNGTDYTLQSVSPSAYMEANDKYGITGGRAPNHRAYRNWLIQQCVVEPKEIGIDGLKYFDDNDDDIGGAYDLANEIETFLSKRKKS